MITAHATVYTCDSCQRIEVLDLADRFTRDGIGGALADLPGGWQAIVGSAPPNVAPDIRAYCSPRCLEIGAAR